MKFFIGVLVMMASLNAFGQGIENTIDLTAGSSALISAATDTFVTCEGEANHLSTCELNRYSGQYYLKINGSAVTGYYPTIAEVAEAANQLRAAGFCR